MKKIQLLLGLTALLCFSSCKSEKHEEEIETKFLVTKPILKDTTIIKNYVCQINAISHIELRALEKGYLEKIYVDEGELVHKGQLLFQIMPKLYEAEMQKAKAEASFAEIEYRNTKMLADSNVVSANELAMAKAKLEQANAELSLAQVHLGFTEIKAPFDGLIDRFRVRLGSLLDEGELLTNLSDNSQMWVYFNVPEAEYLNYKTIINKDSLMQVKLLMANNKIFDQIGVVETIEADFNNETGNIQFRATFPNPNKLLRHGETGNILATTLHKDALIIPQKATLEILEKTYVYVVNKENIVNLREVTIESELDNLFIISKGLTPDDNILLEGIRKVRENDKIEFEFVEPALVLSNLQLYSE